MNHRPAEKSINIICAIPSLILDSCCLPGLNNAPSARPLKFPMEISYALQNIYSQADLILESLSSVTLSLDSGSFIQYQSLKLALGQPWIGSASVFILFSVKARGQSPPSSS